MTRYSVHEDGKPIERIGSMHAKHVFDNERRMQKYRRRISQGSQVRRSRHRLRKAYRVFDVWMDRP